MFQSRLAQPVFSIVVRWAAFCPFSDRNQLERTVELLGGPGVNPDSVFVYTGDKATNMADIAGALSKLIGQAPGGSISFGLGLGDRVGPTVMLLILAHFTSLQINIGY